MSNPKFKVESYTNLGGINSKISPYVDLPTEFDNLLNFDMQMPGAITKRWGSTQYVTQTFGAPISVIGEYTKLDGTSFVIIGHTGGLWFGATTGQSQGVSFTNTSATLSFIAFPPPGYEYNGYTLLGGINGGGQYQYQGLPNYIFNPRISPTFAFNANPFSNGKNNLSLQTFVNNEFMADSQKYFRFDGITTYPVGLLPPLVAGSGASVSPGATIFIPIENGVSLAGSFFFYASYIDNRGFESQIWPVTSVDFGGSFGTTSSIQAYVDLYTPTAYGLSSINVYSYFSATQSFNVDPITAWMPGYNLLGNYPVSGGATTRVPLGTTFGGISTILNNLGPVANLNSNQYNPFGFTLVVNSNNLRQTGVVTEVDISTYAPGILEIYKESVFAAGFSSTPSTVWFSDPGEPEGVRPTSNFEVRTNDGDYVTCMRAYSTRIYIFKKSSFHALTGDNAANYDLQEISQIYGCLNNNAAVIFDDTLVFLDRKGLMSYNGAQLSVVSTKVQPFFDRMNFNVAVQTATVLHDKLRNQILIGIPVDGSSVNNLTLVYDYVSQGWTTYNGYTPTYYARIQGYNNLKTSFYGSFSGTVNWFGASFMSDNGVGFTAYFKSKWMSQLGESIQKQFRRLYLNADSIGSTYAFPLNFYQDYGPSIVKATTFTLGAFQNRIDYGISAKALSFEISYLNANSPLRIYGWSVEARLQRRV